MWCRLTVVNHQALVCVSGPAWLPNGGTDLRLRVPLTDVLLNLVCVCVTFCDRPSFPLGINVCPVPPADLMFISRWSITLLTAWGLELPSPLTDSGCVAANSHRLKIKIKKKSRSNLISFQKVKRSRPQIWSRPISIKNASMFFTMGKKYWLDEKKKSRLFCWWGGKKVFNTVASSFPTLKRSSWSVHTEVMDDGPSSTSNKRAPVGEFRP